MDKYKNELLYFGLYGTSLSNYKKEEIKLFCNTDFVDIFYKADVSKIENDFNGDTITKLKDYDTIIKDYDLLNIRIKFNIFKERLLRYKFKEDYPYRVIDFLLKADGFVKSAEIREHLHLDSKKLFYVAKKLRCKEVLEQKRGNGAHWLIKINKDKLFENKGLEYTQYDSPFIPIKFCTEIPILDQIKKLIGETYIGITTEDMQKQFGLSIRQSLHYLNKIIELNSNRYKWKEIFIGRVKRRLFYLVDNADAPNYEEAETKKFITINDRIDALNQMLEEKRGFVISEDTQKQFQHKMNYSYFPCKKTIMSTALKAGHKIYALMDTSERKTLIIHKDVDISSYLNNNSNEKEIDFNNKLEKSFYHKFVLNEIFLPTDNLFITDDRERITIFFDFLVKNSVNGYTVISKELIYKMNLKLLFNVIPVEIPNILLKILDSDTLNESNLDLDKLKDISYFDLCNKNLFYKFTKKLKISLSYRRIIKYLLELETFGLFKKYIGLNTNIESLNNLDSYKLQDLNIVEEQDKLHIKTFSLNSPSEPISEFIVNEDFNILMEKNNSFLVESLINKPFIIKIHSDYKSILSNIKQRSKKNIYVSFIDRIKCFDFLQSYDKSSAYKNIKKFIEHKYFEFHKEVMKIIDNIIGNVKSDSDEITADDLDMFEFLYTKIKYDLVLNDYLDPSKYIKFSCINAVLHKLNKDEIIYCTEKKLTVEGCRLKNKIKTKLNKGFNIEDTNLKKFIDRNTIYKMYFIHFYELLVKYGSMELQQLLDKCKICKDFEFYNFLKAYEDVFEINEIDNFKVISVKIDMDPLDII